MLIPVILAGGTGSRLWPLSRSLFPKQFHALFSGPIHSDDLVNDLPLILGDA